MVTVLTFSHGHYQVWLVCWSPYISHAARAINISGRWITYTKKTETTFFFVTPNFSFVTRNTVINSAEAHILISARNPGKEN
jgi:hypothetical protein